MSNEPITIILEVDSRPMNITIGDTLVTTGGLLDGRWLLVAYDEKKEECLFKDGDKVMRVDKKGFKIWE